MGRGWQRALGEQGYVKVPESQLRRRLAVWFRRSTNALRMHAAARKQAGRALKESQLLAQETLTQECCTAKVAQPLVHVATHGWGWDTRRRA